MNIATPAERRARKWRAINKLVLLAGATGLVAVLLNPPARSWMTATEYTYVSHKETETAIWIGQILAVVIATATAWYFTRPKKPRSE
jgi:hypothetical protein